MKRLLTVLTLVAISSLAEAQTRPTYNCSNTHELDREIVVLAAIHDSSNRNPVVQNAVRNELRFHEVMREDLMVMCSNVYDYRNRIRPTVKTTFTVEEWYEILD